MYQSSPSCFIPVVLHLEIPSLLLNLSLFYFKLLTSPSLCYLDDFPIKVHKVAWYEKEGGPINHYHVVAPVFSARA